MKNKKSTLFVFLNILICHGVFAQKKTIKKMNIETGKYGIISLVVKKDSLMGVFQFYNHWKNDVNDFESKNDYYFYGMRKNNSDTINLMLTNPYEKQVFGDVGNSTIIFKNDTLNYFQSGLEGMFQPVYFPDKINKKKRGYRTKLTEKKDWKEIRFVKSDKTFFFTLPNIQKKKAYLLKYDVGYVLESREGWSLLEYYRYGNSKPLVVGWIKESDLFSSNPNKW